VRRSGIEIFSHAIDLGSEPSVLLAQMHDLAGLIASTWLKPGALLTSLERA
jgi:hypothetical protein